MRKQYANPTLEYVSMSETDVLTTSPLSTSKDIIWEDGVYDFQ